MRVLVCGGRDFEDTRLAFATLNRLHMSRPVSVIIHGGASGADARASWWAYGMSGVSEQRFDADWTRDGKAAGPIRNQRMLDEGKPDLVIAFPGGKGTADMVRRARSAGVDVMEVGATASRDGGET